MEAESDLYFAFGSNLCAERLQKSVPHLKRPESFYGLGKVDGWGLHFARFSKNWQGASATMRPTNDNSVVWGALWRVTGEDMQALDIQEGVPRGIYRRVRSPEDIAIFDSEGNPVSCFTYLMNEKFEAGPPSPHYLHVIKSGAQQLNLPKFYQDELLCNIPTNDFKGTVGVDLTILPNGSLPNA